MASPHPQQGNAPPQGFLPVWYPLCRRHPHSGLFQQLRATAPALPAPSGRELPLPCSCLPLPAAAPGSPRAGRCRQVGAPGLAPCPAELRACNVACSRLLPPAGRQQPARARAHTHSPAGQGGWDLPAAGSGSPCPRGAPSTVHNPGRRRMQVAEQRLVQLVATEQGGRGLHTPWGAATPPALAHHCPQQGQRPRLAQAAAPPGLRCRNLAALPAPAPQCVGGGLGLLLLQKTGGPSTPPAPACCPYTAGPCWGGRHCHPSAGEPLRPACVSCKARGREGRELHSRGPPQEKGHRGVWAGCYRLPRSQGGVGARQGLVSAAREITPGLTFVPISNLPGREGSEW